MMFSDYEQVKYDPYRKSKTILMGEEASSLFTEGQMVTIRGRSILHGEIATVIGKDTACPGFFIVKSYVNKSHVKVRLHYTELVKH